MFVCLWGVCGVCVSFVCGVLYCCVCVFVFCVCGFECGIVCVVDLCVSDVCRVGVRVFVCLGNV